MQVRFSILLFCVFLLANLGRPALANADGLVVWDLSIADAVGQSLAADRACQATNPYVLYRQTCVGNQLNITLERSPFERLTDLDRLALFVNKYRNLNASRQILPGIKFKVNLNLTNVYRQQAKIEARLGVRW